MSKVSWGKIKVLVFQLINKSPVNLVLVDILIFPAIVYVFYTVLEFHKADIFGSIGYKSVAVEYSLVTDIFIEVHIMI